MTEQNTTPAFWKEPEGARLPRVALMGEFSAGKSTLANLMIGKDPLPVQVVATQLPPVWIRYGDAPAVIVDMQGNETPCDMQALKEVDPDDTAFIRLFCEAEILKHCDIIDMPGISDPNMASDVWSRMMPFSDGVLWCSPATQAWRQSEAAVWEETDEKLRANSLLVLTRGDMLLTQKDKSKVLKRVVSEAGDAFADVLMVSLVQARDAGEDEEIWAESGADAFVERFLSLLGSIHGVLGTAPDPGAAAFLKVTEDGETSDRPCTFEDRVDMVVPRRPVPRRKRLIEDTLSKEAAPDPLSFMPKFS